MSAEQQDSGRRFRHGYQPANPEGLKPGNVPSNPASGSRPLPAGMGPEQVGWSHALQAHGYWEDDVFVRVHPDQGSLFDVEDDGPDTEPDEVVVWGPGNQVEVIQTNPNVDYEAIVGSMRNGSLTEDINEALGHEPRTVIEAFMQDVIRRMWEGHRVSIDPMETKGL